MVFDRNNPELYFHLGEALEKAGDPVAARQALETSLKFNPENFDARLLLGNIDHELGDFQSAADQFEGATFLKFNDPRPRIALARILLHEARYADALKQLEAARALGESDPVLFELLAKAYAAEGRANEARISENKASQRKAKR